MKQAVLKKMEFLKSGTLLYSKSPKNTTLPGYSHEKNVVNGNPVFEFAFSLRKDNISVQSTFSAYTGYQQLR